jgi:ATP-binding cassette subfamily F protein 3
MLRLNDLDMSYGSQPLFEGVSLQMGPGERLGLIGRNGHGKSTLFRIILGEEQPNSGSVVMPRNYRIGHLAQHLQFTQPTVLEEGCLGLPEGEEWDHYKVERILSGLGFSEEDMQKPPSEFSGGYQVRLQLTKVLVSAPNLLLLDEPTNYLDIISIRWITKFLRAWPGELIIISHDREFMDAVTTHTAAIHRCKLKKVAGGTEKLSAQIAQEEEIHEKTRVTEEKRRKEIESFVTRFRAQATKAAAVQSRVKMLDKMPSKDKLAHIQSLDFSFHYSPIEAKTLMDARGLHFHYQEGKPLITDLNLIVQNRDRIAIIGKNGRGKSTLLNLLAEELPLVSGEIQTHPSLRLGYFGQTNIDRLSQNLTVEEEILGANNELGRTAARTLCGIMMFSGDSAEKKVSVLSGGEKSRVMLGKILAQPANLLFLDEPTNHLDMPSIEALVEAIRDFEGAVVIVTHNEMILRELATKLVVFQKDGADIFLGNYDEFLEKIGWEEEAGDRPSRKSPPQSAVVNEREVRAESKKEKRRGRAEIVAERSKALSPIKKEMETLEAAISQLEAEMAKINQELADSSQKKDVNRFITLSKNAKEAQKGIDENFEKLEKASKKHDEKNQKFEELLEEIGEE